MILKLFLKYILIFSIFSFIYFATLHSPILSGQKIIFYRGSGLIMFVSVAMFIGLYFINKRIKMILESVVASIALSAAIHIAILIVFPVTFDRSITMFLLNQLQGSSLSNQCSGFTKSDLEDRLISEFIRKNHALDKRLREQSATGFLIKNNNCVELTNSGKLFIEFSKVMNKIYGIK